MKMQLCCCRRRVVLGVVLAIVSCQSVRAAETLTLSGEAPFILFDKNLDGGVPVVPPQQWQLDATDLAEFVVEDVSAGTFPFRIAAGTTSNALYLKPGSGGYAGQSGIGINCIPDNGESIAIRATLPIIKFEDVGGATPHYWKIAANRFYWNLFNEEPDGSEVIPFLIENGAPSESFWMKANGNLGLGTAFPNQIGTVSTGGNARHLNLDAGTGIARSIVQGDLGAELYMVHKGAAANRKIVRFGVNGGKYRIACMTDNLQGNTEAAAFCIDMTTTNVGIKTPNPTKPLQVGDVGANDGNGAHVTSGGVWTNASSRTVKDDIQPVSLDAARNTIRALQPVTYRYKNERDEQYVGFIAEDVPELVATNDRKSLAPMDVVAVLTRVVQDQERRHEEQERTITRQKRRLDQEQDRNDRLETVVTQQQVLLDTLTRRLSELETKKN